MGVEWRRAAQKPNEAGKINTEICLKILDAADDSLYVLGEPGVISNREGARRCSKAQRHVTLRTFASRSVTVDLQKAEGLHGTKKQPSGTLRRVEDSGRFGKFHCPHHFGAEPNCLENVIVA